MKKIIILIISISCFGVSFSQINREVQVKPFIDTTSVEFKGVFNFWNDYIDTLFLYTIKSQFKIKETNQSINAFWTKYDVENYHFPDLIYGSNFGMAFYPAEKEYFLGFAHRDTNLFEIRTMFIHNNESVFNNFPDIMMSVFIIKNDSSYSLYNKFSKLRKENKIVERKIGNITYYHSTYYSFNIENAQLLQQRIIEFKKGFKIDQQIDIKYLVADNFTEILDWFGVNYYNVDYNGIKSSTEGRVLPLNNMILSGGGGENYMHEIIHVFLKGFRKGNYSFFEEGIACYFGDHQGQDYQYHAGRLKSYLNNNKWINLSKSLKGFYRNSETDHSYEILDENYPMKDFKFYRDDKSEYSYIIHAILCEMAYRKGSYEKVLELLAEETDNESEFYEIMEKHLGIKRIDIDKIIRRYLDENY